MNYKLVILLILLFVLTGCTSNQPIEVTVSIDGESYTESPVIVNLNRERGNLIQIRLTGYRPFSTKARYKELYWMFANINFDNQITLALDITTGHLYKLIPENMSELLNREEFPPSIQKDKLYLVTVREVDESAWWRNIARLKPLSEQ